jgi:hypothetical protein
VPGAKRKRKVISKLTATDHERVNALVDKALLAGKAPVGVTVYAELDDLARRNSDGQWVEGVLKTLAIERLDDWSKDREREQGSNVNLGSRVAFVADTRSARVRVYTKDGVAFAWQHEFWWRADWDRLAQMIQLGVAQQDTLGEKVAAMRRVYALKDRYPMAKNGEEACSLMGLSVEAYLASAP